MYDYKIIGKANADVLDFLFLELAAFFPENPSAGSANSNLSASSIA